MARSTISTSESDRPRRVSVGVERTCLTELAAWYRSLVARAANPVIWAISRRTI